MKLDLDDLSTQIREYLMQNKFSEEIAEVILSLIIQQALQLIYTLIQLHLDETDVRSIDAVALENGFEEAEKASLYKEYFEDKTGIDTYVVLTETVSELFLIIKNQADFFSKLGSFLANKAKDGDYEEIVEYLDQIADKSERDLKTRLDKMLVSGV